MCSGIALARSEIPTELSGHKGLPRRAYKRREQEEYRFLVSDRSPCLPILRDGRMFLARWGNERGRCRHLPRAAWTWLKTIEDGGWQDSGCTPVVIPATLGLERGRWFRITHGIRGLLAPDEHGNAVVFMVIQPSDHYYQTMTGSDCMPVMISQQRT